MVAIFFPIPSLFYQGFTMFGQLLPVRFVLLPKLQLLLFAVAVQLFLMVLEVLDEAALSAQRIPFAVLQQEQAFFQREFLQHHTSAGLLVDVAYIDLLVDAEVLSYVYGGIVSFAGGGFLGTEIYIRCASDDGPFDFIGRQDPIELAVGGEGDEPFGQAVRAKFHVGIGNASVDEIAGSVFRRVIRRVDISYPIAFLYYATEGQREIADLLLIGLYGRLCMQMTAQQEQADADDC